MGPLLWGLLGVPRLFWLLLVVGLIRMLLLEVSLTLEPLTVLLFSLFELLL